MKNNKGVTLIALIVTIIVLLILAGVVLLMILGQNGILNRAQEAKVTTAEKVAKEKVELSVSGAIARSNYGELTIENLEEEVGKYSGEITGNEFPVTVIIDGKEYIVTSNGKVSKNTLASLGISNENIGDYIDLGNDVIDTEETKGVTTDDWRILYVDETTNKVHVILADYLPKDKIPEGNNISKQGYNVWSTKDRTALLDYIEGTDKWSRFANGISGATVTGGPTIDLIENSYKANHNGSSWSATVAKEQDLYVPHNEIVKEDGRKTTGYWSASPYPSNADTVWFVGYSGGVYNDYYSYGYIGVRPVVCLPSETPASKTENGWKVEQ